MDLIEALKKDHKKIRKLIKEARKQKSSYQQKKLLFRKMAALTDAHLQAEEKVVYLSAKSNMETRPGAYSGIEEHSLIEQLILEDQTVNNQDVWEAKFKVVCDLLELHFDQEEDQFFPQIRKVTSRQERKEKAAEYQELFEDLFDQSTFDQPISRRTPSAREIRAH